MSLHCTLDLINLAASSNSLVAFCFCNLIIAILLVGGSKPSRDFDHENPTPLPGIAQVKKCVMDDGTNSGHSINMNENNRASVQVKEASSSINDAVIINGEDSLPVPDEDGECESEENDELRRRIEEFIDKVNRGWKAEKLRM